MCALFALAYHTRYASTVVLFFMTCLKQRRGCIMFQAVDNSKYSWNTHDHSCTIIYKSMTSANGGTYAGQYSCDCWVDNLESTSTSSVEYPNWFHLLLTTGGDCKRRAMCPSKDLNEIFRRHHSRCVCPSPCFGQKRLRTLLHQKRQILYRCEGSKCPLKKTPYKRPRSKAFQVSFRKLHFKIWGHIFSAKN